MKASKRSFHEELLFSFKTGLATKKDFEYYIFKRNSNIVSPQHFYKIDKYFDCYYTLDLREIAKEKLGRTSSIFKELDKLFLKHIEPPELLNQIKQKLFHNNCDKLTTNIIRYNIELFLQDNIVIKQCPEELLLILFFLSKLQEQNDLTTKIIKNLLSIEYTSDSMIIKQFESLSHSLEIIPCDIIEKQINERVSQEKIHVLIKSFKFLFDLNEQKNTLNDYKNTFINIFAPYQMLDYQDIVILLINNLEKHISSIKDFFLILEHLLVKNLDIKNNDYLLTNSSILEFILEKMISLKIELSLYSSEFIERLISIIEILIAKDNSKNIINIAFQMLIYLGEYIQLTNYNGCLRIFEKISLILNQTNKKENILCLKYCTFYLKLFIKNKFKKKLFEVLPKFNIVKKGSAHKYIDVYCVFLYYNFNFRKILSQKTSLTQLHSLINEIDLKDKFEPYAMFTKQIKFIHTLEEVSKFNSELQMDDLIIFFKANKLMISGYDKEIQKIQQTFTSLKSYPCFIYFEIKNNRALNKIEDLFKNFRVVHTNKDEITYKLKGFFIVHKSSNEKDILLYENRQKNFYSVKQNKNFTKITFLKEIKFLTLVYFRNLNERDNFFQDNGDDNDQNSPKNSLYIDSFCKICKLFPKKILKQLDFLFNYFHLSNIENLNHIVDIFKNETNNREIIILMLSIINKYKELQVYLEEKNRKYILNIEKKIYNGNNFSFSEEIKLIFFNSYEKDSHDIKQFKLYLDYYFENFQENNKLLSDVYLIGRIILKISFIVCLHCFKNEEDIIKILIKLFVPFQHDLTYLSIIADHINESQKQLYINNILNFLQEHKDNEEQQVFDCLFLIEILIFCSSSEEELVIKLRKLLNGNKIKRQLNNNSNNIFIYLEILFEFIKFKYKSKDKYVELIAFLYEYFLPLNINYQLKKDICNEYLSVYINRQDFLLNNHSEIVLNQMVLFIHHLLNDLVEPKYYIPILFILRKRRDNFYLKFEDKLLGLFNSTNDNNLKYAIAYYLLYSKIEYQKKQIETITSNKPYQHLPSIHQIFLSLYTNEDKLTDQTSKDIDNSNLNEINENLLIKNSIVVISETNNSKSELIKSEIDYFIKSDLNHSFTFLQEEEHNQHDKNISDILYLKSSNTSSLGKTSLKINDKTFKLKGVIIINPNNEKKIFIRNEKQYWFVVGDNVWISSIRGYCREFRLNISAIIDVYFVKNKPKEKVLFNDPYFLHSNESPNIIDQEIITDEIKWMLENAISSVTNPIHIYSNLFNLKKRNNVIILNKMENIPWEIENAFKDFNHKINIFSHNFLSWE